MMTTAGVYGFVTAIEGDVVWLEIAEGVEIRVAKGAIARRITPADDAGTAEPAAADGGRPPTSRRPTAGRWHRRAPTTAHPSADDEQLTDAPALHHLARRHRRRRRRRARRSPSVSATSRSSASTSKVAPPSPCCPRARCSRTPLGQAVQIIRNRVDAPRRGRAGDHPPGRRHRREPAGREGPGPRPPARRPDGRAPLPPGAARSCRPTRTRRPTTTHRGAGATPVPAADATTRRADATTTTVAADRRRPSLPPARPTTAGRPTRHDGGAGAATDGADADHRRARHHHSPRRPGRPGGRAAREQDGNGNVERRYLLGPAFLTGSAVNGADAVFDQGQNEWAGQPEPEGRRQRHRHLEPGGRSSASTATPTCPGIGAGGTGLVAITLDGIVQSAPEIQPDNRRSARSRPTRSRSRATSARPRPTTWPWCSTYGALPVQLEPQAVQTVSATLGKDSLQAGVIAGLVGVAARGAVHVPLLPAASAVVVARRSADLRRPDLWT